MQYNIVVTFKAGTLISAACAQRTQRCILLFFVSGSFDPLGFRHAKDTAVYSKTRQYSYNEKKDLFQKIRIKTENK